VQRCRYGFRAYSPVTTSTDPAPGTWDKKSVIILDEIVTGPARLVLPQLQVRTLELTRYSVVKIGQSVHPLRRWRKHRRSRRHKWNRMVVLYSTSSHKSVCEVERALISTLKEMKPTACRNIAPGGEGVNNPSSYNRFYIYALVGSKRSQA